MAKILFHIFNYVAVLDHFQLVAAPHVRTLTHIHTHFQGIIQSSFSFTVVVCRLSAGSELTITLALKTKHTFVNITRCSSSCLFLSCAHLSSGCRCTLGEIWFMTRGRIDSRSVGRKVALQRLFSGSPEVPPPRAGADYEGGVLVKWSRRSVEGSDVRGGEQAAALSFHSSQTISLVPPWRPEEACPVVDSPLGWAWSCGGVVSNRKREDFDGVYFPVCISEPLTSAIYIQ